MVQRAAIVLATVVLILISVIIVSNIIVGTSNRNQHYNNIDQVPYNRVGLLLGTSKYLGSGYPNPYFRNRIMSAAALFHAGKIEYILASGDHRNPSYNEPQAMLQELVAHGVPVEAILLDHEGIDTLASVARSGLIFGNRKFIIISQRFHNRRALYIADHFGFDAIAFDAGSVSWPGGLPVELREVLARVKVMFDLHLLRPYPRPRQASNNL